MKRRSYYKWQSKGKPIANNLNADDAKIIFEEFYNTKEVYGTHRLKHHIKQTCHVNFNHKKIRRYKLLLGLETITRKRRALHVQKHKKDSATYMAPNLLNCNFDTKAPLEKLSTDVSYISCTDGRLYLSAVKDLFNKQIITHSVSDRNDVNLVLETLKNVPANNGIMHSDQGSLYYSGAYIEKLKELNYDRSMSHKGHCWENSPIENWFSQLKEEHLRPIGLKTKKETILEIKKYVEWYNTQRIQKGLGYLSPVQYLSAS